MKTYAELTRNGQLQRLRQLAQTALPAYQLNESRLILLNNVDTPVFRLDAPDGKRFVLRVHNPLKDSQARVRSNYSGLKLFAGIQNWGATTTSKSRRKLLTELNLPQIDGPRFVTILSWVEGRFRRSAASLRSGEFKAVGSFMARLHNYVQQFQPPADFIRRTHDWNWLFGPNTMLDPANTQSFYTPAELDVFRAFSQRVRFEMDALGQAKDVFNLIHADLHQNNYLFKGEEVRAIDFQDCAWGYFLSDMAVTLDEGRDRRNLDPTDWQNQRAAFFEGYQRVRALPERIEERIQLFEAIRMTAIVNWVLGWPNIELKPWGPHYLRYALKQLENFV